MTPAKTPTPQGISALLRKAGFEKSVAKPSSIKGLHEWSAGYHVTASMLPGSVLVAHRVNSLHLRTASRADVEAAKRAAYAEAIAAAGWQVEAGEVVLIVTPGTGKGTGD